MDGLKKLAGSDLGRTDWMEITQDRVNTFADATDDHQWIHVDTARAAESPFGDLIAHGYLTLSLIIPQFTRLLKIEGARMAVNYGLNKVRFPSPVLVGSRIRLRGAVENVVEVKGNGVETTLNFTVEVENADKPACVAQAVYRHYF
ncbi:MaoC family dehydratase [Prauserella oleivorans]|uniref:MaoC family dehydratase n=1 Tax=Prauserella oleivorans TaxID=1478153 RepID=A0ABW5W846_9PSEU